MPSSIQAKKAMVVGAIMFAYGPSGALAQSSAAVYSDWEVLEYPDVNGARICAAHIQPGDDGIRGVHWAVNAARLDELPTGYLSIHPNLVGDADTVTVTVDNVTSFTLQLADDGYAYNNHTETSAVIRSFRAGGRARLQIQDSDGVREREISLTGFTAATNHALGDCGA